MTTSQSVEMLSNHLLYGCLDPVVDAGIQKGGFQLIPNCIAA